MAVCWICFQLSLAATSTPLASRSSIVGSVNTLTTPNGASDGPNARTSTGEAPPRTMYPPIITSLPVPTKPRVEIFASCDEATESTSYVICKRVDKPATMRKFALLHVSGCRRISVQLLCNSVMHSADGHCFPREATLTGFEPVLTMPPVLGGITT